MLRRGQMIVCLHIYLSDLNPYKTCQKQVYWSVQVFSLFCLQVVLATWDNHLFPTMSAPPHAISGAGNFQKTAWNWMVQNVVTYHKSKWFILTFITINILFEELWCPSSLLLQRFVTNIVNNTLWVFTTMLFVWVSSYLCMGKITNTNTRPRVLFK